MRRLGIVMGVTACAVAWAAGPITQERLVKADAEPGNWLMYSGNYGSYRYSGLDQINRENVATLRPAWPMVAGVSRLAHLTCSPLRRRAAPGAGRAGPRRR